MPKGPTNHSKEEAHERNKDLQGTVMSPTSKMLPCDSAGLCPLRLASFLLEQRRGLGFGLI